MGKMLTRKELKDAVKVEKVVFDDGDFVFVKLMMGTDRGAFEVMSVKQVKDRQGNTTFEQDLDHYKAKLVVCCLCSEKGINLYAPEEYKILAASITATRLEKIAEAATELNALDEKAKKKMVKNSEGGQPADISSASVKS